MSKRKAESLDRQEYDSKVLCEAILCAIEQSTDAVITYKPSGRRVDAERYVLFKSPRVFDLVSALNARCSDAITFSFSRGQRLTVPGVLDITLDKRKEGIERLLQYVREQRWVSDLSAEGRDAFARLEQEISSSPASTLGAGSSGAAVASSDDEVRRPADTMVASSLPAAPPVNARIEAGRQLFSYIFRSISKGGSTGFEVLHVPRGHVASLDNYCALLGKSSIRGMFTCGEQDFGNKTHFFIIVRADAILDCLKRAYPNSDEAELVGMRGSHAGQKTMDLDRAMASVRERRQIQEVLGDANQKGRMIGLVDRFKEKYGRSLLDNSDGLRLITIPNGELDTVTIPEFMFRMDGQHVVYLWTYACLLNALDYVLSPSTLEPFLQEQIAASAQPDSGDITALLGAGVWDVPVEELAASLDLGPDLRLASAAATVSSSNVQRRVGE